MAGGIRSLAAALATVQVLDWALVLRGKLTLRHRPDDDRSDDPLNRSVFKRTHGRL